MEKKKTYDECRFDANVLRSAISFFENLAQERELALEIGSLSVDHDDCKWTHDNVEEFLADYRKFNKNSHIHVILYKSSLSFSIDVYNREVSVSMSSNSRENIEAFFDIFERSKKEAELPALPVPEKIEKPVIEPTIFIGHGQSKSWRELKDHLQDQHKLKIEAYESGARAGHTIRDILEEMLSNSSFALLVLTAEDEQEDGGFRARQNVIHEAGLFQGRIGFSRAIMLLEEGVESFSNVQGVQYIRFSKGNIKETFGDVLATLKREFPESC